MTRCRIEREKFYPGPGLEPGPLALRASALPLSYPGQVPIHDRIKTIRDLFRVQNMFRDT